MFQDPLSNLVYRVHPLPQTMMEYVWDYGFLKSEEEVAYIKLMVKNGIKLDTQDQKFINLFTHLLSRSHSFLRHDYKGDNFVSLRDVNRCVQLFNWFLNFVPLLNPNALNVRKESVILALSLCYHARLPA